MNVAKPVGFATATVKYLYDSLCHSLGHSLGHSLSHAGQIRYDRWRSTYPNNDELIDDDGSI